MRILLVSQMYPVARRRPTSASSCADLERELVACGHDVERAVLDTRTGGKRRYLRARSADARRRAQPDVVYAHFLVPAGLIAALAAPAPLVVTAHGRTSRTSARSRASARRRASSSAAPPRVIAVSDYLRRELEAKIAEARGKTEVDRLRRRPRAFPAARARAPGGPPAFLCIGSLTERKNVLRLARAFERLGEGTLTFVGDGPLRAAARGRARHVASPARVPHDASRGFLAASRRPLPAVARRAVRPVDARGAGLRTHGRGDAGRRPAGVRPAGAGVLVDPLDEDALVEALRAGGRAAGPEPGRPRGGRGARPHGVRPSGSRRSSCEPLEVGEPDLDERPHALLDPGLARDRERLLVALARLLGRDALLQPVVARSPELLDAAASLERSTPPP